MRALVAWRHTTSVWCWRLKGKVHVCLVWNNKIQKSNVGCGLPWWLSGKRIHLPMQETQVRSLVQEDPTCCGATKPVHHDCWACALEPGNCNYWAMGYNRWSLHIEELCSSTRKSMHCNEDQAQAKINKIRIVVWQKPTQHCKKINEKKKN